MSEDGHIHTDFVREIVEEHKKSGRFGQRVQTRWPPEPSGYIHIGHAKTIHLNFSIADENGGTCNLRFDDTNPQKEEGEFVESIINDVRWLGYDWEDRLYYASNYFDQLYEWALELIRKGVAYVDDLSASEMAEYRGDVNTPGRNSPFRDRSIEENLDLFQRMRNGEFEDGERVLRARIDMGHPNMNMRDPVMYRILHSSHHNTGDKWCIYPSYDWTHGQSDSIEGITHSICTLEFENHRPLYDWFLEQLDIHHPQQIEVARLNLTYTVLSKRRLRQLVEEGFVNGYDDPRMPTISGVRRRGYPPEAIREFMNTIGVAKVNSNIAMETLESAVRDHLNITAPRFMGVLDPLKVIITNLPDGHHEEIEAVNNPEDETAGTRMVPFTRELYIERRDFMEDPVKKFFRLSPGGEVRLRYAYLATCNEVIKDGDDVVELRCTIDPDSRGGNAPDGRKVKGTIHWVSASEAVDAEIRLYDRLFTVEDPQGHEGEFKDHINPDSVRVISNAKVEPLVKSLPHMSRFQFERTGYFCIDPDSNDDHLAINRTVGLRDTWARIQKHSK